MSKQQYRKAKFSELVDWKSVVLFSVILLIAVVHSFFEVDTDLDQDLITMDQIPAYSGSAYVEINGNVPSFGEVDPDLGAYEEYNDLDELGRCTQAVACVSPLLMPKEERGDISSVKPTGWHSVQYDFVDGKSLYNRCHLIGYQLTGENANEKNLITGTRYMNVEGMLPFENLIADYVKETENRVLYRVTPIFEGDELVARGVQMEAWSIEDNGEGICFNVFCYNVQPGVEIDYATGDSQEAEFTCDHEPQTYILNISSGKYHLPTCSGVSGISDENKETFTGCYEELEQKGYAPCGTCDPGQ